MSTPQDCAAGPAVSVRKQKILENAERMAPQRAAWIDRNRAYYDDDRRFMRFLVPKGARILDIGCGNGELLRTLEPSYGLGIDLSKTILAQARNEHPHLHFEVGDIEDPALIERIEGPFDYIILSDTVGVLDDIEVALRGLHRLCTADTRIVIAYHSRLWEPVLNFAERAGLRMPQPPTNYLANTDLFNILDLADFEPIKLEFRQLIPRRAFGLGRIVNRFLAPLPGLRRLCLRQYLITRSLVARQPRELSATIVIP